MNSVSGLTLLFGFVFCSALPSVAASVNDGTSTNNLIQLSNINGTGEAADNLNVDTNGFLVAAQSPVQSDFALHTVWYARDVVPTGGVYTVSADFQPADASPKRRGGVMGWLSLTSSNGIALQVIPNDPSTLVTFRVSVIDFSAGNPNDNDSFGHLFDTNGTAAELSGAAESAADPNYATTNFATFRLDFSAPTAADLAALSNATAHVTAKVFQTNAVGAPIQVGPTIELLTDLPRPAPTVHRLGYLAVWFSFFEAGDIIGYLDNLIASGEVGAAPNVLPSIDITSPTNGATFTEPANITIQAMATDSDGSVARVDFFAGTNHLGTSTNSPASLTWTNVAAGRYSLTAQATDDRGGTSTSNPVNVTVTAVTGVGPRLTIVLTGNTVGISWMATGYQLQMKTNLSSLSWTDVPVNTVNLTNVTLQITSDTVFFRLVQVGAPGGPKLAIQASGASVVISWPAQVTGYRLQSNTNLSTTNWADVPSANNQATETASVPAKFYRLINP